MKKLLALAISTGFAATSMIATSAFAQQTDRVLIFTGTINVPPTPAANRSSCVHDVPKASAIVFPRSCAAPF